MQVDAEVSTPEEGPAGSIVDDLRAAFADLEEQESDLSDGPQESAPEAAGDSLEAEPKEPQPALEGQGEEAPEEAQAEPAISAPEHWSAADKETFNNAPPELKDWILNRHKQMEGDYTRKTQEIAEFKREFEPVSQLFAPYRANLEQMGVTPAQYIERLARADMMMAQDPIQGIQWIAQQYGIDLANAGEQIAQQDPEVMQLKHELNQLRANITQREQQEYQSRQTSVMENLTSFAEATTETGEPAHPYFNEVIDDMIALAQAEVAKGKQPDIKDLYDRAVWANTSTRSQLQSAQQKAAEKKAQEEARAKAAQAKKASKSVTGSSGRAPDVDLSLREELQRQLQG